jgi:predicted transposase/invertase (TIGR01784 family)
MLRLLSPKLDVNFKRMFAAEQSRDVLISLLTAVLRPAKPIVEVTVINPELPVDMLDDKSIVLDVLVRLDDGSLVDVEMQTESRPGASARALYYWARLASSELHRGEQYVALRRVVLVLILGYRAFPDAPFHGVFQVRERQSGVLLSDVLEIHSVELPRLGEVGPEDQAAEERLVLWARFMNARELHEFEKLAKMDPIMARAKSILEQLSADPSAQEAARQRELGLMNWHHSHFVAREEGKAEGEAKGKAEGEAKGKAEGKAEGEAKGKAEGEAKGKAEGEAKGVLVVLRARGLVVSPDVEDRVKRCTDLAQLDEWLRRAVVVASAEEIFG